MGILFVHINYENIILLEGKVAESAGWGVL